MDKALEVFLSNRLEILYQQLKQSLFGDSTQPLIRRLVMVYGPAMKNWLSLRMAQDPDLNVAMGIEFIYLGQAFDSLLELSTSGNSPHFPSTLELSLAIEVELQSAIHRYPSLNSEEQNDWEPVMKYLKLKPDSLASNRSLSRKAERRVIGLSEHLARLFLDYGRYASEMAARWEKPDTAGWQPRLWRKLFIEKKGWSYPARALQQEIAPEDFSLHIFSISFMTAFRVRFFEPLSPPCPGSLLFTFTLRCLLERHPLRPRKRIPRKILAKEAGWRFAPTARTGRAVERPQSPVGKFRPHRPGDGLSN